MDKQLEKVRKYAKNGCRIPEGARILVGFSGGADSLCLLRMLKELQGSERFTLAAVHVHHGIRGEEAEEDLAFAREIAAKWEIPFYEERVNVPEMAEHLGMSLEEAGRKARYDCFYALAERLEADCIAVAHHRDDQAETVLHHMLRGSGLRGLGGIRARNGKIVRPLLCLSRREIEEWLGNRAITWREDATNRIADVTRNKIRLRLLPWIEEEIQPGIRDVLIKHGAMCSEIEDYLEEQTRDWKKVCVLATPDGLLLREEGFRKAHGAIQKRLIFSCLEETAGTRKDLGQIHVQACLELMERQCGRSLSLPYQMEALRVYEGILFRKKGNDVGEWPYACSIAAISREEFLQIPENDYTKCFDYDRINYCLVLRKRKAKDRICVYRDGRSKKLQDFLVDQKVPARLRDEMPFLADGDQIVWAVGLRVSAAYQVTEETRHIVKVTIYQKDKTFEKQEEEKS